MTRLDSDLELLNLEPLPGYPTTLHGTRDCSRLRRQSIPSPFIFFILKEFCLVCRCTIGVVGEFAIDRTATWPSEA